MTESERLAEQCQGPLSKNMTYHGTWKPGAEFRGSEAHTLGGCQAVAPPADTLTVSVEVSAHHDFPAALSAVLYRHKRITRAGWNGKGMWVYFENRPGVLPHLMMRTAQGGLVPWVVSHTDMTANDWAILPD